MCGLFFRTCLLQTFCHNQVGYILKNQAFINTCYVCTNIQHEITYKTWWNGITLACPFAFLPKAMRKEGKKEGNNVYSLLPLWNWILSIFWSLWLYLMAPSQISIMAQWDSRLIPPGRSRCFVSPFYGCFAHKLLCFTQYAGSGCHNFIIMLITLT